MTGVFLDGTPVVAKTETGSVTCTVVGKICVPPLTAQTNDFFTFEEWYSDKSRSELFPDCKVNQVQWALPAAGPATVNINVLGVGTRTLAATQSFTSPTAETTTGVIEALHGLIYANGAAVNHVTSISISVDRGITPVGATVGSNVSPDLNQGRLKVSGSFTAMFDDAVISTLFDAETKISLACVATVDGTATSDFMGFTMGKVAITTDTPDDGERAIMRTYAFTAEINGAGGPALAFDQTILSVQDSAAP
jgi:hypothetical protein